MNEINDLECGLAGEHLVCAELLMMGHRAFLSEQNCPYDVAVDIGGRLVRIQVKATREPRAIPQRVNYRAGYLWHVRRAGKKGQRTYAKNDFDMLALVALDCKRIAYMPPSKVRQTVQIRAHDDPSAPTHGGKTGKTFVMFPFESALREVLGD